MYSLGQQEPSGDNERLDMGIEASTLILVE